MNDMYQLQNIVLKDNYNHIISQYAFEYIFQSALFHDDANNMDIPYNVRYLSKIKKLDLNNNVSEITEFPYAGAYLKRIINPSGGVVEYNTITRISSIKYYNNRTDTNPVKTTTFDYHSFADNSVFSGYLVFPDGDINQDPYIIYKNVKVSNSDDNNGYTKYYYKAPDDYPKEDYIINGNTVKLWRYYNIISGGLLDKKEVYDAQNKLLVSEKSDYTLDDVPGAEVYISDLNQLLGSPGYDHYKLGWMKKLVNTSTTYFDNNQTVEESSETNFNVFNFETASTKSTIDGDVIEKFITYPESGYPKLASSHILTVPVIMEDKTNGKLASKTETKFDNLSSTLPTSVVTTNINDTSTRNVTIDQYDDKGNVLQYTAMGGFSTAVVYGYDKTKPIAKIEGATYAQVSPYIQAIIDASNADAADSSKEYLLYNALNDLRVLPQLKDFQITGYTYDPLIGATQVIQINGISTYYMYDSNNRLVKVYDGGIKTKEYKYNYKNQ